MALENHRTGRGMTAVARKTPQQLIEYYSYRLEVLRNSRDPSREVLIKVYESLIAHNLKLLQASQAD